MSLRQQIIQDRVDETANALSLADKDMAFLRLVQSVVTGESIHAFDPSDLVDGGQDKQIDTITIEETAEDEATVYIVQAKNTDSFSSNMIIQMHNGLHWVFEKSKTELEKLSNAKFRDKILEYRSSQRELGATNIRMVVAFVTAGHTKDLSAEFKQEAKSIVDEYNNGTFEEFRLLVYGCDELVTEISAAEKVNKKIDADIKIRYDANNPSLIKYHSAGLKGMVCSAPGREIAKLVNSDPSGFLFDSNIRRFLGGRGAVNADIRKTCSDKEKAPLFWFLNNGITIACDSFDAVTDPDKPLVKIKNIQIVNGCQTATTLAQAKMANELSKDVYVMLRIYEAPDNSLVNQIVLTTNNQNKISSRDLRANDQVQVEMQMRFRKYQLYYERKAREYDKDDQIDRTRIAANELVAQSYLAVAMKKPSDARRRKYKVWGDLYKKVFGAQAIEPYVIAFLLHRLAARWLKRSGVTTNSDDVTRRLGNNGIFHVIRIAAFLWRGTESWNNEQIMAKQIEVLEKSPAKLDKHFQKSFNVFRTVVLGNSIYAADLDGAMKSSNLDAAIDKYLHPSKGEKRVITNGKVKNRLQPVSSSILSV